MEEDIKTKQDLFNRLRPAMNVKLKDIKRDFRIDVTDIELFSYLEDSVWKTKYNLSLIEMVEDILNTDINKLFNYLEKRRKHEKK